MQVGAAHFISIGLRLTVSEPVYPGVLACFYPAEMLGIPRIQVHIQCDGDSAWLVGKGWQLPSGAGGAVVCATFTSCFRLAQCQGDSRAGSRAACTGGGREQG